MKKFLFIIFSLATFSANAYETSFAGNDIRIIAQGSGGMIGNDSFSDYFFRLQAGRKVSPEWNLGAVYSLDKKARDANYLAKDAFVYGESYKGRIEFGWTESIASKLALVLPDVGGTRLNDAPFFLDDKFYGITSPVVKGNQYALRVNIATVPTNPWQIGWSFAPKSYKFDYSTDMGLRWRKTAGKIKESASFALSYIDSPHGLVADNYIAPVYADARYQATSGYNLQLGSLLIAFTGKITVDDSPKGFVSDGFSAGAGLAYDFLAWSASADYILSDVGAWDNQDIFMHTGVLSLRYKITKNFSAWGSVGTVLGSEDYRNDFFAAGIGISF